MSGRRVERTHEARRQTVLRGVEDHAQREKRQAVIGGHRGHRGAFHVDRHRAAIAKQPLLERCGRHRRGTAQQRAAHQGGAWRQRAQEAFAPLPIGRKALRRGSTESISRAQHFEWQHRGAAGQLRVERPGNTEAQQRAGTRRDQRPCGPRCVLGTDAAHADQGTVRQTPQAARLEIERRDDARGAQASLRSCTRRR